MQHNIIYIRFYTTRTQTISPVVVPFFDPPPSNFVQNSRLHTPTMECVIINRIPNVPQHPHLCSPTAPLPSFTPFRSGGDSKYAVLRRSRVLL